MLIKSINRDLNCSHCSSFGVLPPVASFDQLVVHTRLATSFRLATGFLDRGSPLLHGAERPFLDFFLGSRVLAFLHRRAAAWRNDIEERIILHLLVFFIVLLVFSQNVSRLKTGAGGKRILLTSTGGGEW